MAIIWGLALETLTLVSMGWDRRLRHEGVHRVFMRERTISDVARLAGVSAMTVSRVMNGRAAVRAGTREAVLKAVATLGYTPNAAARKLATGGVDRIGLIYSNPSAGYLSEFLLGALEGVERLGAQLIVEPCRDDVQSEQAALKRLAAGGVRAVVLPPPHGESLAALAQACELGMRVVAVAASTFKSDAVAVRIDDRKAAADIGRYLLGLGHLRFGFITGAANQTASSERREGFLAEIRAVAGATVAVEEGAFTYRSGYEAAEILFDRHPELTAVFASNDDMAAGVLAAAHRRGLDVPGRLSVVGFDDTETARSVWPALTTVRQPISQMAAQAVALLGERDTPPADVVLGHELVVRETSGPAPAA